MDPTLKRSLEGEVDAEGNKKAKTDDLGEIRVLIDNYEASIIIGKGGANVKQVRADSGAFVSILKNDNNISKERVMTVKGTDPSIATAMKLIHVLLLEGANSRKLTQTPEATPDEDYGMKLLIHKFLAGSIIGKAGVIIREIQESTKARVSLSNEPMGISTEKTCTITGSSEIFAAGLTRVLAQVMENPLRPGCSTVLYTPGAAALPPPGAYGAPPGYPYGAPPSPYGAPASPYGGAAPPSPYGAPPNPYGAPAAAPAYGRPAPASPYGAPAAYGGAPGAGGESKTEKIVIPTVCAGTVIGKGGSIISDIKRQSGTNITIADASPSAPDDRVVAVTGPAQGIATAIFMIKQRVENYRPPEQM